MTNKEAIKWLQALKKVHFLSAVHKSIDLAIKALEGRQTGEWIVTQEGRWLYPVCSLCGGKQDVKSNYCPDCGARMKKEEENGK